MFWSRMQASHAGWIQGSVKKEGLVSPGQENRNEPHEAGFRSLHLQFNHIYIHRIQKVMAVYTDNTGV